MLSETQIERLSKAKLSQFNNSIGRLMFAKLMLQAIVDGGGNPRLLAQNALDALERLES